MAEDGASRRSNIVTLSIVGLVGTVWIADKVIPQEVQMRRNLYGDRATCERDYPPPPDRCEPHGSNSSGGHAYYHGPYYNASRSSASYNDPGSGRTGTAHASETTTRGGFGAFGRAVHAVG